MESNKLYKYESDFDFDVLAEEVISEVSETNVEAAEDNDKLVTLVLIATNTEYRDDSIHLRRALEFVLRDIGGNPTVSTKVMLYSFDMDTTWQTGTTDFRSEAKIAVTFTRPDFLDVRQIAMAVNMMRRIFSEQFDFSWSYMIFMYNGREFRVSGKELPFSTGINGRIIKGYSDAKSAYKFCIALVGIENASDLFEQTMCVSIERAMLENYLNQKNDRKRSSFVIPEEQRAQVRGYRPSVYISNLITADKAQHDTSLYIKRGLYAVRDLLPTPYVKVKNTNTFFPSVETSRDIYVYVVYNVLVDDDLNMCCIYNEIPIRECLNLQKDVAKDTLKILKYNEMKKQQEGIEESRKNDTSNGTISAT